MTPDALHKRAERQRRREAGYRPVEVWLHTDKLSALDRYCKIVGISRGDIIAHALKEYIA